MTAPTPSPKERQVSLFEAIQRGSHGWQRVAYDEYFPLVRGLVVGSMGPMAEVEDLISDVFVGFFESAPNIRSAEGMRSYIVSIAMNVVRRERRKQRRRRLLFFWEEDEGAVERVASPEDPKAKAALLQLNAVLDELGEEERMVYVLHMLQGLPLLEVADALDSSLSTVKRRLKKAQERVLRRVMKNPLLADYVRERSDSDKSEVEDA